MQFFEGLKNKNKLFIWREHTRKNRNVKDGASVEMHIQPGVEIIFVTDGKIDILVNGNTETAHTGEAALIFPFQPHGYKKYGGSEFIRFDIDSSLARDFFNVNCDTIGKKAVFKVSETTDFIIRNNFVSKTDVSQYTAQSFLYSAISDFSSQNQLVQRKKDDNILINAITYIRKNKEKDLKMSGVAKALGYSQSYFSYAINKNTGFGFNTLLAMIRIENAKILLRETDKTILEIILECGFGSERSFYRQFNDMVGTSPLKYRNSASKSHLVQ